jgi:hypothetical protein
VRVAEIDVAEQEIAVGGKIAGWIDVLPLGKVLGIRSAQEDRLVVGADHRHHHILRADAASVIVELHGISDVELFTGRQVVKGEIGRGKGGVDGAGTRAGILHDAIDMEECRQFGGPQRPREQAGRIACRRNAGHGRGVPVLARSWSTKLSVTCAMSGEKESVWPACSDTVATAGMLMTGLSSVPVTVSFTVCVVVPP